MRSALKMTPFDSAKCCCSTTAGAEPRLRSILEENFTSDKWWHLSYCSELRKCTVRLNFCLLPVQP